MSAPLHPQEKIIEFSWPQIDEAERTSVKFPVSGLMVPTKVIIFFFCLVNMVTKPIITKMSSIFEIDFVGYN